MADSSDSLRIPIGYWAFETYGSPYYKGEQTKYLDKAIGWAKDHDMKVWVDLHGLPGSQNGQDNSGHAGDVKWQTGDNEENSIEVLKAIAKKYGAKEYADVVVAIELANEPKVCSGGQTGAGSECNDLGKMKSWTEKAFRAVRDASANDNLRVIMHDGFLTPQKWVDVGKSLNPKSATMKNAPFGIDTHLYQNQQKSDSKMTNEKHIRTACQYTNSTFLPQGPSQNLPVYVGEFSFGTNICVKSDGTTTGDGGCGSNPDPSQCQCTDSTDPSQFKSFTKAAKRKFVEAQLTTFKKSAQGFFVWNFAGPGEWGLDNAIDADLVPNPINDPKQYKYPDICSGH
jgi:glucan 1,3-beta-glucosidase